MVTINRFSKAYKLIPLKGLPTALETATTLFHHVFRNYGLPEDIVCPQFTLWVWWAFCEKLGSMSSGYHSQAEQLNQEILRFLQTYCSREQHRWCELLPWAEYAQNSFTHSSIGLTPFQCVLGYQPPLFPWSEKPSNISTVDD